MSEPLPMLLFCPACGEQHIDAPNPAIGWTDPPHRSHECQACHHVWRPADVATTGVAAITTQGAADGSPVPQGLAHAERILRADGVSKVIFNATTAVLFDQLRVGHRPAAKASTLARAFKKLKEDADA